MVVDKKSLFEADRLSAQVRSMRKKLAILEFHHLLSGHGPALCCLSVYKEMCLSPGPSKELPGKTKVNYSECPGLPP